MPWLATCKCVCVCVCVRAWWIFSYLLSFWPLCGFHYWKFCENFICKDITKTPMVNIFRTFWLMIFVSVRMNSNNLLYLMVGGSGYKGFLKIEEMMPNFLLTRSAVVLLVRFTCRTSSLRICPFLTFVCYDIFSLKYSCQFDLHAASAGGVGNASLTIQLVQWSGFDLLSQLLWKLAAPWVY